MKVLVKRTFHLMRLGEAVPVFFDATGLPVPYRNEGDRYYIDFPRGALELTADEFNRHLKAADLELVPARDGE